MTSRQSGKIGYSHSRVVHRSSRNKKSKRQRRNAPEDASSSSSHAASGALERYVQQLMTEDAVHLRFRPSFLFSCFKWAVLVDLVASDHSGMTFVCFICLLAAA